MRALHEARLARQARTRRVIELPGGMAVTVVEKKGVGIGSIVWEASRVLAGYLCALDAKELVGKRVLELGSGVGLAGACAARLGAMVTLTERADIVELTRETANANSRACKHVISVRELDWMEENSGKNGHVDLILGADILFGPRDNVGALARTLNRLSGAATRTVMCFKDRSRFEAEFFGLVRKAGFDVKFVRGCEPGEEGSKAAADGINICVLTRAKQSGKSGKSGKMKDDLFS